MHFSFILVHWFSSFKRLFWGDKVLFIFSDHIQCPQSELFCFYSDSFFKICQWICFRVKLCLLTPVRRVFLVSMLSFLLAAAETVCQKHREQGSPFNLWGGVTSEVNYSCCIQSNHSVYFVMFNIYLIELCASVTLWFIQQNINKNDL